MILPMVGTGTDVHAFDPQAPCWVAGLKWDGVPGLAAHSDGDVASHAICDALLSAADLGDLGSNFGLARPEWANAPGTTLISEVVTRVHAADIRIVNVAAQIIGNQPRLGQRREAAQQVLTRAVGAPVRLSATTTDGLGMCGRGEGLAAHAVALVVGADHFAEH